MCIIMRLTERLKVWIQQSSDIKKIVQSFTHLFALPAFWTADKKKLYDMEEQILLKPN